MNQCKYLAKLKLLIEVVSRRESQLALIRDAAARIERLTESPSASFSARYLRQFYRGGATRNREYPVRANRSTLSKAPGPGPSTGVLEQVLGQGHKSRFRISTFRLTSLVWLSGRVGHLRERWPSNFFSPDWADSKGMLSRFFIEAYGSHRCAHKSDILWGK